MEIEKTEQQTRPREYRLMEPTPEMRQHMALDKRLDAVERRIAKLEERLKEAP